MLKKCKKKIDEKKLVLSVEDVTPPSCYKSPGIWGSIFVKKNSLVIGEYKDNRLNIYVQYYWK